MVGVTPVDNEECKSEAVTKDTIFSHIRKKSRSFPVIVTSPKVNFSPSQAPILTEKTSDKMDMKEIHREVFMLPDWDPVETSSDLTISKTCSRKMDEHGYSINDTVTVNNFILGSPSSNGKSELYFDISSAGTDWMETKSSVSHIFSASGSERALPLKEQLVESKECNGNAGMRLENAAQKHLVASKRLSEIGQSEFSTEVSSSIADKTGTEKLSREVIIIDDDVMADGEMQVDNAAQKHHQVPESLQSVGKSALSSKSSSAAAVQTKTKMPFSDIFVGKADGKETVWHRPLMLNEWQEPGARSERKFDKQPCSSAAAGKEKEVSFLGFKSVFSFL